MVYSFDTRFEHGFFIKSDKLLVSSKVCTEECKEGFEMVKLGVERFVNINKSDHYSFGFNADECGCAMEHGEWILLCLSLLKRNGCISLDGVHTFSVMYGKGRQIVDDLYVTRDGDKDLYVITEDNNPQMRLSVMENFFKGSRADVEDIKDLVNVSRRTRRTRINDKILKMNVVDFCSMFALNDVLHYEFNDSKTLPRVLAVLMGSHGRLGGDSLFGRVDKEIIVMIVKSLLSPVMLEAIESGIVRF